LEYDLITTKQFSLVMIGLHVNVLLGSVVKSVKKSAGVPRRHDEGQAGLE
jgi:hypothetical protein